jgi:hypothetical protein
MERDESAVYIRNTKLGHLHHQELPILAIALLPTSMACQICDAGLTMQAL